MKYIQKYIVRVFYSLLDTIKLFLPKRRSNFKNCGERVFVHNFVRFHTTEEISLGDDIYFGPHCKVYGHGGIEIQRGVVFGENVTLIGSNHNFDSNFLTTLPFENTTAPKIGIKVGEFAWIAQNAIILPGVSIGEHSVIAAGSVVTNQTVPYGIYAGVPAKLIRMRKIPTNLRELQPWARSKSNRFHLF